MSDFKKWYDDHHKHPMPTLWRTDIDLATRAWDYQQATIDRLREVTDCFADWVCLECGHMAQAPNSLRGFAPFAHPEFMNCDSCGKETRHLSHREWQLQLNEKNHLEFVKSFQEATGKVPVICECGEQLGSFGNKVTGYMIFICPKCERSSVYHGLTLLGDMSQKADVDQFVNTVSAEARAALNEKT